jgi:hypothetical protein
MSSQGITGVVPEPPAVEQPPPIHYVYVNDALKETTSLQDGTHMIRGLTPDTTYVIYVVTWHGDESIRSNEVTVRTEKSVDADGVLLLKTDAVDFADVEGVTIFDPTMDDEINAILDADFQPDADEPNQKLFDSEYNHQFGEKRRALFFKPGSYPKTSVNLPFYYSVHGLGRNPDDTSILNVRVANGWTSGDEANATQHFWRSVENMRLTDPKGVLYATSQAAPFRRMHVDGGIRLQDGGYASGGYFADCKFEGLVESFGNQQWYTRDSTLNGGWGAQRMWNIVLSGCDGRDVPRTEFGGAQQNLTSVETTPRAREKPYIFLEDDAYHVRVPDPRPQESQGASWNRGETPGRDVPMSDFFVTSPGRCAVDGGAHLNVALAAGKHVLFPPGLYDLKTTLRVTEPGTVVMGIGYATLRATSAMRGDDVCIMDVADVDGVRLCGLMFDLLPGCDIEAMLRIGGGRSRTGLSHALDYTSVQDVFFRVGGAAEGVVRARVALSVVSDDVLLDHTWVWLADHGAGTRWTENECRNGLEVWGDRVTATGLFVEHFKEYNVSWFGNEGETLFYQSEIHYEPPPDWSSEPGTKGWAAYKVHQGVTEHKGTGLGVYAFFNPKLPPFSQTNAIEVPRSEPGILLAHLVTVSYNGGPIDNVVNGKGGATGTNSVHTYDALDREWAAAP